MLPPDETMIRLLLRVVEEFVPPFATGKTPLTPVVREMEGMSAATRLLNVGVETPPDTGPANTVLAVSVDRPIASVPLVVIGVPDTVRKLGTVNATDVTVPPVPVALIVVAPFPYDTVTPLPAITGETTVYHCVVDAASYVADAFTNNDTAVLVAAASIAPPVAG